MKKLRFALSGFFHETNTYATEATGVTTSKSVLSLDGPDVIGQWKGSGTVGGGFIEACERLDIEIVPGFYAYILPSSTIEREAYESIKGSLLASIERIMPVDAVMIELHGAAVVEDIEDPEGDLLEGIRGVVGPEVKIISTLDLHGKITDKMVLNADYLNGVLCYPHLDLNSRAQEAVERIVDTINANHSPRLAYEYIPVVFPVLTTEEESFARDIKKYAQEIAQREKVLDCTVLHGFPYSDTSLSGMRVMVTTDDDVALAKEYAKELASYIWENRSRIHDAYQSFISAEDALAHLKDKFGTHDETEELPEQTVKTSYGFIVDKKCHKPILLADVSDNPGCGCTGDATFLLKEMIKANLGKSVFLGLKDVETVNLALKHGVGATIEVELGGKHGKWTGNSVKTKAYVKSISDGRVTFRGLSRGMKLDMGPIVRLIIGNVEVVAIQKAFQGLDDNFATELGIQYSDYNFIAIKSAVHFRAFWMDKVEEIMLVDTPALGSNNIELFPKENCENELYPFCKDFEYAFR